jgi:hypothetical protein
LPWSLAWPCSIDTFSDVVERTVLNVEPVHAPQAEVLLDAAAHVVALAAGGVEVHVVVVTCEVDAGQVPRCRVFLGGFVHRFLGISRR